MPPSKISQLQPKPHKRDENMSNPPPQPPQLAQSRIQINYGLQQKEPSPHIKDSDESELAHQHDSPKSPTVSKIRKPLYTYEEEPDHSHENALKKFKNPQNVIRRAPSLIRKSDVTGAFSENSEV